MPDTHTDETPHTPGAVHVPVGRAHVVQPASSSGAASTEAESTVAASTGT
jgi:hypothetical protein